MDKNAVKNVKFDQETWILATDGVASVDLRVDQPSWIDGRHGEQVKLERHIEALLSSIDVNAFNDLTFHAPSLTNWPGWQAAIIFWGVLRRISKERPPSDDASSTRKITIACQSTDFQVYEQTLVEYTETIGFGKIAQ